VTAILKSLCRKSVIIRELIESNSIEDLVNLLVFRCPPANEIWRERAMSVFDVIIEFRVSSDAALITYLCEKKSAVILLKNLEKLSPAEIVIVVGMVARMVQVGL